MFSKVLMSAAVAMGAANAFQEKNFNNKQCGMKCCAGVDSDMDHDDLDSEKIPDSLQEFADKFDNEKCGMFCQMQGMFNDTLSAAMGNSTSCEDDCCKMPPASANNTTEMCGSTCCAPPTTNTTMCGSSCCAPSSAKQEPLPESFEFEQCDMMCQLNNTISGFASQAWNGTAVDAMAGSDSSDSDL